MMTQRHVVPFEEVTPEQAAEWLRLDDQGKPVLPYNAVRKVDLAHTVVVQAQQMRRWQQEHALANDGCVPGAAYRDAAERISELEQQLRQRQAQA